MDTDEAAASPSTTPGTQGEETWAPWDVRRCLFDNHMSSSFDKNIEYMFKHFGFVLPDAPCLRDPEGLLQCAPPRER